MFVIKRSGQHEPVKFDKVTARIRKLCHGLHELVNPVAVAQKVVAGVYDGVTTTELDTLASETAASLASQHPDYSLLAGRLAVSSLYKSVPASFGDVIHALYSYINPKTGQPAPLIAQHVYDTVMANKERLDAELVHAARDFEALDYFAFKTLERSYLLRMHGQVAERPQHMWMRVAIGIHADDIAAAVATYHLMSQGWFTHASPTLFNAATPRPALSSCFLLTIKEDSIEGIYETLKQCALISKNAGGIGLALHDIRATGSYIAGTNGVSNGLVPMLRVFNDTARYCDQGGNKRKGAFAVYLEPWHADIFEFLDLRKNHGKEEARARDLFYGLWVPDLFMKRVQAGSHWSLFCPHEAPGLADVWGPAFEELYTSYEAQGKARRRIKAQELWFAILAAQQETGTPYMLYKDACNSKSNQQHLGTIRCANLCTEIVEYTSPGEVAVCTLASLALPRFVRRKGAPLSASRRSLVGSSSSGGGGAAEQQDRYFDFKRLAEVTAVAVANLDKIIDINYYPVPEAKWGHQRHRPLGLGVQGLADVFVLLGMPYDSAAAAELNRHIFETIYFAALRASCQLAKEKGTYESYEGSPASQGKLQHDLWAEAPPPPPPCKSLWDWDGLRADIAKHGLRNSLLVAPMPTASTSQILGNTESFEPMTANIFVRRTLAGEYVVVNRHLVADLLSRGLWTPQLRNELIAANGSIQGIAQIPGELKSVYKTVWEIKQKAVIDMAAARGPFIDQSQSLNIHMADATVAKLSSLHFYAWQQGLKTSQYYLRTRPAADAIKFTVDTQLLAAAQQPQPQPAACDGGGCCLSCGS